MISKLIISMILIISTTHHYQAAHQVLESQVLKVATINIARLLASMIDRSEEFLQFKSVSDRLPGLPEYVLKMNPDSRLAGKQLFDACITQHNLTLLRTPKLWSFDIPQTNELEDLARRLRVQLPQKMCLSEYLEGRLDEKLSLPQTKELITLLIKCDRTYSDCAARNLLYLPYGQIGLIDTEISGFIVKTPRSSLFALHMLQENNAFQKDAAQYLQETINQIQANFKRAAPTARA